MSKLVEHLTVTAAGFTIVSLVIFGLTFRPIKKYRCCTKKAPCTNTSIDSIYQDKLEKLKIIETQLIFRQQEYIDVLERKMNLKNR
jgi:hypothetical protein